MKNGVKSNFDPAELTTGRKFVAAAGFSDECRDVFRNQNILEIDDFFHRSRFESGSVKGVEGYYVDFRVVSFGDFRQFFGVFRKVVEIFEHDIFENYHFS